MASGRRCARSMGRRANSAVGVHKTANVLNKLPKGVQPRAKQHLQDIWMAETKELAHLVSPSSSQVRARTL